MQRRAGREREIHKDAVLRKKKGCMKFTTRAFTPNMNDGKNVFVFGSNEAGIHGAGAAREAERYWGAEYGVSAGHCGNSYAIPTVDHLINHPLKIQDIKFEVERFLGYARKNLDKTFLVTAIGCGLAGYEHKDIAPLFAGAPPNCVFPAEWEQYLTPKAQPKTFPRALFCCSNDFCAEEVSYHADQIYWRESDQTWLCDECWDNIPEDEERGIRLDKFIEQSNLPATALLQPPCQHLNMKGIPEVDAHCVDCGKDEMQIDQEDGNELRRQ